MSTSEIPTIMICPKLAKKEAAAAAAAEAAEARRKELDERFLAIYPHLRPTPERLAALAASTCAHCSARYTTWEHVAHFYCSWGCASSALAEEIK